MGCGSSKSGSDPSEAFVDIADAGGEPTPLRLCKFGCGCKVKAGLTGGGRPYDTCCKTCAVSHGTGGHDADCPGPPAEARPVCAKASRCRIRTADHLRVQAHPFDKDYVDCCAACGAEPEPYSLKSLFDWSDADGSGKLSRDELQSTLAIIAQLSGWDQNPEDFPPISDAAWRRLDEDGNGVVNFSEFASWAGPRLGLPLGLRRASSMCTVGRATACQVLGCPCEAYEKGDGFWGKCKHCKHKAGLHRHKTEQTGEVEFPDYWSSRNGDFQNVIAMTASAAQEFQELLNQTYRKVWTRDRRRHCPDNPNVPSGFQVLRVSRNENSAMWQEFYARRTELQLRVAEAKTGDAEEIQIFDDVKTVTAWASIGGIKAQRLAKECNEFYLFHGTSPEAAQNICNTDFKLSRAGENTGTLYGRGLYFAESITKADEYAKPNSSGEFAVLLCRVLGGNVLYTADEVPDAEELVHQCVEGSFDCVLGDREVCKGTYREFVLFDSEDVYPEYIIEYQRKY
mmetsp:Transcript_64489/g.124268  ORF Transcript_64489/g.124268 Transcript_64489/m.124268 type:complete len:511 (+) Transcript_64489:28-1560(+)